MKRYHFIILLPLYLLTLLPFNLYSQWEVQLDNQNFTHLDRIHFVDSLYGWAIGGASIGDESPYFYTTNGGKQWYLCNDWMNHMGTDIHFVNRDTGFIASRKGRILKTTNGGQKWDTIQTPAEQNVLRLFFVDENNGWATLGQYSKGNILHTADCGETWKLQNPFPENDGELSTLFFINDSVGYGGGLITYENDYNVIMRTECKGESWEAIYSEIYSPFWFQDIYFTDSLTGWIVGSKSGDRCLIMYTADGGETWNEQTLPKLKNWSNMWLDADMIYSIKFINDKLGWLTCSDNNNDYWYRNGYVLLTIDGGSTWKQQFMHSQPIYDICLLNENQGWAVGRDFIYHTDNADTIIIVGVEYKISANKGVKIYPNPNYGNFFIEYSSAEEFIQVQITNIAGNEIFNNKISTLNSEIDISNQPTGIYFITVSTKNKKSMTQKIIKL